MNWWLCVCLRRSEVELIVCELMLVRIVSTIVFGREVLQLKYTSSMRHMSYNYIRRSVKVYYVSQRSILWGWCMYGYASARVRYTLFRPSFTPFIDD